MFHICAPLGFQFVLKPNGSIFLICIKGLALAPGHPFADSVGGHRYNYLNLGVHRWPLAEPKFMELVDTEWASPLAISAGYGAAATDTNLQKSMLYSLSSHILHLIHRIFPFNGSNKCAGTHGIDSRKRRPPLPKQVRGPAWEGFFISHFSCYSLVLSFFKVHTYIYIYIYICIHEIQKALCIL